MHKKKIWMNSYANWMQAKVFEYDSKSTGNKSIDQYDPIKI